MKPPGYYVQRSSGLFPAPIPQGEDARESTNKNLKIICKLFELLGLFLAKCIQDGRRVDIPLSDSFLKLMCSQAGNETKAVDFKRDPTQESNNDDFVEDEDELRGRGVARLISEDNDSQFKRDNNRTGSVTRKTEPRETRPPTGTSATTTRTAEDGDIVGGASAKERLLLVEVDEPKTKHDTSKEDSLKSKESSSTTATHQQQTTWFSGILSRKDLFSVEPHRRKFIEDLFEMVTKRDAILEEENLSFIQRQEKIDSLLLGEGQDNLEEMM